jgi:hypothetical protein
VYVDESHSSVQPGALLGVWIPVQVQPCAGDLALEVVVSERGLDRCQVDPGVAAVVDVEAPPEDMLRAVGDDAEAPGLLGGRGPAEDAEIRRVVEIDGGDVGAASVVEGDARQIEFGRP